MADDSHISEIADALKARRLDVEPVDDGLEVSQGTGIMAHDTRLDPEDFARRLPDDDRARRRQIAGFARGVKHVLLEPSRSDAHEADFVDSAGGLVPTIEIPTFADGVAAAAGEPAWTLDFPDDLIVAYLIELDRGLRVLTAPQVERWGVAEDRITSGARSKLFHETRDLDFQPFRDSQSVHRLHAGDGYDAARCFVVADAFYTEIDDGFRFAMPSPQHFLCVFDDRDQTVKELATAARTTYHEVDAPLSTSVFRFDVSEPVISQEYPDE